MPNRLGSRLKVGKAGDHHNGTLDPGLSDFTQKMCPTGPYQDDITNN